MRYPVVWLSKATGVSVELYNLLFSSLAWDRVGKYSAEDIERMAKDDPSNFLKTDEDWERAIIHRPGSHGPQKAPKKKPVAIRLSPDVVEDFKSTGAGWQSRIDEALRTFLKEHPLKRA